MLLNIPIYQCGRSSGVERDLAKVDVEGSNPFTRSNHKTSLSGGFFILVPFHKAGLEHQGGFERKKQSGGLFLAKRRERYA